MTAFSSSVTRKWTAAISASALALGLLVSAPAAANGCSLTGVGSSEAPYQISDRDEFLAIPSCDGVGKHFEVTGDLSLEHPSSQFANSFEPFPLAGLFDGAGNKITGLRLDIDEEPFLVDGNQIGLFSELLAGSAVYDLVIERPVVSGNESVGVLAGSAATATVERVQIRGGVARGNNLVGGLIGKADGTIMRDIIVTGMSLRALGGMGGLVGELDARGMNSLVNLYFDGYIAQPTVGSVLADSEGIGGLFGRLLTDRTFSLSRSGAKSYLYIENTSAAGIPAGLIGYHRVYHQNPDAEPKLVLNDVLSVSTVLYDSTFTPFGLLVGVTAADILNGGELKIEVNGGYAAAEVGDRRPLGSRIAPEVISSFVNTDRFSATANSFYYYLETDSPFFGIGAAPESDQPIRLTEKVDLQSYEFWIGEGFSILQPAQNQQLRDGGVTAVWYHPAYYADQGRAYFDDGHPIFIWMVELGIFGPLNSLEVPSGQPKSVQASDDVSRDVHRGSWVDAPSLDRIYFDGFFESRTIYDDNFFSYVPPGVSCTNGFQTIAQDAYSAGYFIWNINEYSEIGNLRCFDGGERYRPETAANRGGAIDLGFEVEIAGQLFSGLRPQTNGSLVGIADFRAEPVIRDPFYDISPFDQLKNTAGVSIISPLGIDLVFDAEHSSFWAARTEIEGNSAVVFTWENFSIYHPTRATRPRGDFATFQAVIIYRGADGSELWYNYGGAQVEIGENSGSRTPKAIVDFDKQVNPGTNTVNTDTAFVFAASCERSQFFSESTWFLEDLTGASITDSNLRALYQVASDDMDQGLLYLAPVAGNALQLGLYTDSNCETPLIINQRQNVARDGHLVAELFTQYSQSHTGFPIGHAATGGTLFEPISYREYFTNVQMTELVNGGDQELISQSVGTSVPGRIVTLLPRTAPSAQSPSYSGPVAGAQLFRARAGELATITGQRLSDIRSVIIDGVTAQLISATPTSFSFIVPRQTVPGLKSITVVSDAGSLVMQDILMVEAAAAGSGTDSTRPFAAVIKRTSDSEVKLYVRDIEGAGKVQFMLNGREIGWVRAIDATDPKLRVAASGPMAGRAYFVRTARLELGRKNVLEIYVNGERVRRVAYGR